MKPILVMAAVLSAAISCTLPADAFSCYRHIYFTKNMGIWNVRATGIANVWFLSQGNSATSKAVIQPPLRFNCSKPKDGPCTIDTNQMLSPIEIQYTTSGGMSQGDLYFTDSRGTTRSFHYQNQMPDTCPYIQHSGNSGAVTLNAPANGDMDINGGSHW